MRHRSTKEERRKCARAEIPHSEIEDWAPEAHGDQWWSTIPSGNHGGPHTRAGVPVGQRRIFALSSRGLVIAWYSRIVERSVLQQMSTGMSLSREGITGETIPKSLPPGNSDLIDMTMLKQLQFFLYSIYRTSTRYLLFACLFSARDLKL